MYLLPQIAIIMAIGLIPISTLEYILRSEKARNYIRIHCNSRKFKFTEEFSYSIFHPNTITIIRTLLSWTAIILYYFFPTYFSIYLYVFGAELDSFDGEIARKCDQITKIGEIFDPLCDKCCYLLPIIYFTYNLLYGYLFAGIELIGQFAVRKWLARHGKSVAANNFGKVKAVLAFGTVPYLFLLDMGVKLPDFKVPLLIICCILSLASSIFKFIPNRYYANCLTMLNLVCGITGLYLTWGRLFNCVFIAILGGLCFDALDGRAAVKFGSNEYGKWLDDFADLVSFGIVPAVMIIFISKKTVTSYIIGIIYSCAIFFRLLRFVIIDKQDLDIPPKNKLEELPRRLILFLRDKNSENIFQRLFLGFLKFLFIDKEKKPLKENDFAGLPCPGGAAIVLGASLLCTGWILWSIVFTVIFFTISRARFAHLSRKLIPKINRKIIVCVATVVFVAVAYTIYEPHSTILPFFSIIGGTAYILFNQFLYSPDI